MIKKVTQEQQPAPVFEPASPSMLDTLQSAWQSFVSDVRNIFQPRRKPPVMPTIPERDMSKEEIRVIEP